MENGILYVVATPIGNLEDMTLRALRILKGVDIIYCEDTRVTTKLLDRYGITAKTKRLDANVEKEKAQEIIDRLVQGEKVAYVTDAGTPAVSDPGARLVARAREAGARIEAIPGPSALITALSVSGVPADRFSFLGFLPHKKGRQTLLKEIAYEKRAVVLYESPHRILKLLRELDKYIDDREVVVLRELTKKFENIQVGMARDIAEYLEEYKQDKGEFVVVIVPQ